MLTYDAQKNAVILAMKIDTGTINYDDVLNIIEKNKLYGTDIIRFWFCFNAMTRNALRRLVNYKLVKHLEKCLEVS